MAGSYVLTLQPTFTQGLILGQLSILALLVLVLKYLFLDSTQYPFETSSYHPRIDSDVLLKSRTRASNTRFAKTTENDTESAEWLNMLLQQVADVYRSKLRDDLTGPEGDEVARQRVEQYANKIRPTGLLDYIKVHSVDLGVSAPRLYNATIKRQKTSDPLSVSTQTNSGGYLEGSNEFIQETEFDLEYIDTLAISLSTSYLFNYPMASFARLPVSLTISLSLFRSSIIISPSSSTSQASVLTFAISPDFTLDLSTSSLMGSRAKLANVPKLHELIQHQVRRILATKATWKVVLPGISSITEVRKEIKGEILEDQVW